jgi:hypothetical protein
MTRVPTAPRGRASLTARAGACALALAVVALGTERSERRATEDPLERPPGKSSGAQLANPTLGELSEDPTLPAGLLPPGSARVERALERGLAFLAAQQARQQDGSFPRAGGQHYVPVPLAALGSLAWMASGSSPDRGPYGREVSLAIDYLLARAELTPGSPRRGYLASEGDPMSRMHGHGFATLALCEAFAVSPKTARGQRLGIVLEAAVDLISRSQGLEGGWMYEPTVQVQHENSVTVCLVQALRGARNSGLRVDPDVIARAVDYVGRCQNANGQFQYGLSTERTTTALTAAGIATLNAAGRYDTPQVQRAMDVLSQELGLRENRPRVGRGDWPFYERFYLAQALWQAPDRRLWENWWDDEIERVLAEQNADGSWRSESFGACYGTAMNCLFLAMPKGLLPIFQR